MGGLGKRDREERVGERRRGRARREVEGGLVCERGGGVGRGVKGESERRRDRQRGTKATARALHGILPRKKDNKR